MGNWIETNAARIPTIGLGTGRLKGEKAIMAIHAALDCGYDHIDTAGKYGNEIEVGEAIRGHPRARESIFVTTKVMAEGLTGSKGNTAPELCLERLGLDYVDLLLLHWPNQTVPLKKQLEVLEDAQRQGLARHVGVCNFPADWLVDAVAQCDVPIVANQVERHPYFDQTALAQTCLDLEVALIAFSPLGRGASNTDPVIARIAESHGRTPAQIVLRWHIQKPLSAVVPSSSDPGRIAQNQAVFDFSLSELDMQAITALAQTDGRVVKGPPGYDWHGRPPA